MCKKIKRLISENFIQYPLRLRSLHFSACFRTSARWAKPERAVNPAEKNGRSLCWLIHARLKFWTNDRPHIQMSLLIAEAFNPEVFISFPTEKWPRTSALLAEAYLVCRFLAFYFFLTKSTTVFFCLIVEMRSRLIRFHCCMKSREKNKT